MKTLITPAAHLLALATGASARKAKALQVGRIISFHGVGDGAYSARSFEAHLRYLTKHFAIVSLQTLLERLNASSGLTNEIALTFDDGLRNNFTAAYPLLKMHNAPATFFVCPGLVENGRWLWTHEARARLGLLPEGQREDFSSLDALLDVQVDQQVGSSNSIEIIVDRMKTLDLKERNETEDHLRRLTANFFPTPAQKQSFELMSWEELKQLDPALITVGSHSLTHPILSTLTHVELAVEITESRRMLETQLARPVEFFCYPNGSHNPEVVRMAAENYRAGVTTTADFVRPGVDLHQLPRIGVTPKLAYFAWRLHRPGA